jgi:hypothetical protein
MNQIYELYSEFHIVQMPLLGEEIRGTKALETFGKYLIKSYPEEFLKSEKEKENDNDKKEIKND